ncbi:hypothetical protein [Streptomyces sp. NBC_00038]|uniref:hypothetical protein n=1 Tax=Streptomyces sp. NBC_00038 TaxID=2903615 RepID=UPI00224F2258|nr:hypothetical protein [Streptomyces sp. NBC_00038]MCX5560409.1 hypothetical protein [Streptomyces sp. NBC_00038]
MVDPLTEPASPPTGYGFLLPQDWAQIPLRQGNAEDAVRSLVASAFARVPADVPRDKLTPLRLELERRLRAAVAAARRAEALEMYLPVKLAGEVNLGASFTISNARLPARSGPDGASSEVSDPAEIAVQLLTADGTASASEMDLSSGEVDGTLAVRRERVVPAAPELGAELGSRRVEYLVAVPGDPGQWLVAAFSTLGAGNPRDDLADAMVEWFDALMTTFRWSWT